EEYHKRNRQTLSVPPGGLRETPNSGAWPWGALICLPYGDGRRGCLARKWAWLMPPPERESEGWISSERLPEIPLQDLSRAEANAFLNYLFSSIGRRPRRIGLRQGASVARYLKCLAWETDPGPRRQLLELMSEVIWGTVFTLGRFSASSKKEA